MKTNYLFKARWLQGAASANESKKMQVNPRITPFRFACTLDSLACRLRVLPSCGLRMAAMLCMLLTLSIGNAWGADYVKVTSASDLVANQVYVIAEISENTKYLVTGTGNKLTNTTSGFTVSNNTITTSTATPLEFTLGTVTSGNNTYYTLKCSSTNYLGYSSSTNFRTDQTTTSNTKEQWSITPSSSAYQILNVASNTRYIGRNGSNIGPYSTSNSYPNCYLFKKQTSTPSLTANPTSLDWGSVAKGASLSTKTFSISGSNLTSGSLSISASTGWSVSPTSKTVSGTLSETTITVTPPSTATAGTKNGTITISGGGLASSVTVSCSLTVQETYTVNWYVGGSTSSPGKTESVTSGSTSTPPSVSDGALGGSCSSLKFVGWSETNIGSTPTTKPADLFTAAPTITTNKNYYAVFATASGSGGYEQVTSLAGIHEGSAYFAYYGSYSGSRWYGVNSVNTAIAPVDVTTGVLTTSKTGDGAYTLQEFTLVAVDASAYEYYIKIGDKYVTGSTSNSTNLSLGNDAYLWKFNSINSTSYNLEILHDAATDCYIKVGLSSTSAGVFRSYTSSGQQVSLFLSSTTYSDYVTSCCTALGSINGSVNWSNPTTAVVTWDNLDHVAASNPYAVTWKTGAGSYSSTGVGSITGTTTKTCTITGLNCNTNYDFKIAVTAAANYCDKEQVIENENSGKYAITLTGDGTVTGGLFSVTDGDNDLTEACNGDLLSLEAVAADGYEFSNWEITHTTGGADAWDDVEDTGAATDDEIIIDMPSYDITVNAVFSCIEPSITADPVDGNYSVGASPSALSVTATLSSGTLTYLWKVSTNGGSTWSNAGGTNNAATYSGSSLSTLSTGTTKFKCIVGNSEGGCSVESEVATITVTAASYFVNGKTIFIQAHSTSAWTGGGCVKAWFHTAGGSEAAQSTYWLFDAGSPDEGKKLYAAIVPATGNLPYLDIQRFAANCNDWWNKNGGCSYADASGSNAIRSTGKHDTSSDGDYIRWNDDAVTLGLRGDPDWDNDLATFADQGSGVWTATYNNYAPANAEGESQEFKICTNYNGWIGNTGSNNNVTVSDMHVGSTYNISASYSITAHTLTLSKTFVKGTVHFDMQSHGSAISDLTNVNSGSKISAPSPAPTDAAYDFGGWYKEAGCTNAWNFSSDVVNETMTLYAKWTAKPTYSITYNVPTCASVSPTSAQQNIIQGNAIGTLPTPTSSLVVNSDSYTFHGWATSETTEETTVAPTVITTSYVPAANTNLYAVYKRTADPVYYTDTLTVEKTAATSTSYTDFKYTSANTSVVYEGQTAKGNDAIQVNNTSPHGIVTTANPNNYVLTSFRIKYNSNTSNNTNRKVKLWAGNKAPANWKAGSFAGIKIGTNVYTSGDFDPSKNLVYTYDFAVDSTFLGIEPQGGAQYWDSIYIKWRQPARNVYITDVDCRVEHTITVSPTPSNGTVTYSGTPKVGETITLKVTPAEGYATTALTATYNDGSSKTLTLSPALTDVAADYTFTMPDYDVTVSATFAARPATPTISHTTGKYANTQSVTINCETGGATIYYTTDGSAPTSSSSTYSSAISVSSNTTIKAIAYKAGVASLVATSEITILVGTEYVAKTLSEIWDNDEVIYVGTRDAKCYAMSNDKGTGNPPAAIDVTDSLTATSSLVVKDRTNIQWNIIKDCSNDTLIFYPNGTTSTWLYTYNNNNGVRVGTGDDKKYVIKDAYLYNTGQGRYAGKYKDADDWRCYTSIHDNIKNTDKSVETFTFYVKSPSTAYISTPCPATLTGFNTTTGTVSDAQSFSVKARNITSGNVTITAPTDFEVCLTENGTYTNSITLTPVANSVALTTVYVRVKQTATYGEKDANVTIEATGATTRNVNVKGTVNPLKVTYHSSSESDHVVDVTYNQSVSAYSPAACASGKVFLGWASSAATSLQQTPVTIANATGAIASVTADVNYYAVFASQNGNTIATILDEKWNVHAWDGTNKIVSGAYSAWKTNFSAEPSYNFKISSTTYPAVVFDASSAHTITSETQYSDLKEVRITASNRTSFASEITVKVSANKSDWTTVDTKSLTSSSNTTPETIVFTLATKGDYYVQISVPAYSSKQIGITNIRLYKGQDYYLTDYSTTCSQAASAAITWENGGGTIAIGEEPSAPASVGDEITLPTLSKADYRFDGWKATINSVEKDEVFTGGDKFKVNHPVTFTAQWTQIFSATDNPTYGVTSYKDMTTTSLDNTFKTVAAQTKVRPVVNAVSDAKFAVTINSASKVSTDSVYSYTYTFTPTTFGSGSGSASQTTATVTFLDKASGVISSPITLRGRSLPEEFVIAVKKGDQWVALPNTLQSTSSQPSIVPVNITVDNTTTPAAAVYAPTTAIYKAAARYQNAHTTALRFTNDGSHWLQVSGSGAHNMWLSSSGGTNVQDWLMKSADFNAYELTIPSNGSYASSKMGIYTGGYMGYHSTLSASDIYLLPVTNKLTLRDATVKEWGEHGVIVEADMTNVASASLNVEEASPSAATLTGVNIAAEAALTSVKNVRVYAAGVTVGAVANEGKQLYIHWKNSVGEEIAASQITIPVVVAADAEMHTLNGTRDDWNKKEVHVLPGATLTADAGNFTSKWVTVPKMFVYPGATLKVTKGSAANGTLNIGELRLRNGWTRAGEKQYNVARVYIADDAALTKTTASMDLDIYERADGQHYYPFAVPFATAVSAIDYADETLASASIYGKHYGIDYYDGAARASGGNSSGNWKQVASDATLQPCKGYTIVALPVKGEAIIRVPLTYNDGWTADGELATYSDVTKNVIAVTGATGDAASSNQRNKGWYMLGVPFMSCYDAGADMYSGAGAATLINGLIVVDPSKQDPYSYGGKEDVPYVSVPAHDFSEYIQTDITEADLRPGWSFFVQVAEEGNLTFAVSNQQTDDATPPYAPKRQTEAVPVVRTGIILSDDEKSDKTTLLISDKYSAAEYEINADLEKMFGEGYTLATYSLSRDTRLAYNAMSTTDARGVIPIGFRAPEDGEYTFSLNPRYANAAVERVDLIDYQTGEVTNLMMSDYTFTSARTQDDERFALNVVPMAKVPTGMEDTDVRNQRSDVRKIILDDKMYIIYDGLMYDATGKRVTEINK